LIDSLKLCIKTWDGGAFQLLLPEILGSEHLYSKRLKESFQSYSRFIVEQAKEQGSPIPVAFSASSQASPDSLEFGNLPVYNGGMGHIELVATANPGPQNPVSRELWDLSVSPHAVFLAMYFNLDEIEDFLRGATTVVDQTIGEHYRPLFSETSGWMDGYIIRGNFKGKVVPMQFALDQEMIALSILKSLHGGSTLSAKTLASNSFARSKMLKFYKAIDLKLESKLKFY
jgi:hypothetical protein